VTTKAPKIGCRLYLITPPQIVVADFLRQLEEALDGGDVACLQIRLKQTDDQTVLAATKAILPVAHARDVAVIMNDRPDLARAAGCDGVHIGQDDGSYADARRAVGPKGIVGVTCHGSRHLAMEAADAGADYVAFGAFFETATKDAKERAAPEILNWWSGLMEIPCVAIGGITPANAPELVAAGADFLAVSSGVWAHPDGPKAAVQAFNRNF
jgi:thiamine-phosphate pyrophosphorylase